MANNRWWSGLSKFQWTILFIAWLGWVFDIMDTALFSFAKVPMMTELLGGPDAYKVSGPVIEGRIQTIFLIGWAIGGLVFGVLADKYGRTKVLIWTILIYCLLTGLTAFCQTWEQVACVRFLTALGIGGEWAAGAALVAEVLPDRSRAAGAALLQTAAAVGPSLAALANLGLAGVAWRWLFLVGVAPAIITVAIRYKISEPERQASSEANAPRNGELSEFISSANLRRNLVVAMVLGIVGVVGAGNVSFWLPNLVKAVSEGLPEAAIRARTSNTTLFLHVGTLAGVLIFPMLCERLGRKWAFLIGFSASIISVLVCTFYAKTYTQLFLLAPLMALTCIGLTSSFGLYFPELFPERLRATGCSLAYNSGRILAAPFTALTGAMIVGSTVPQGVAAAAVIYVVGLIALPFGPETKGKPLPVG